MDLQTKAVAVAVAEIFAVTGVGNDLPGGAVNILAGNAGLRGGDGGQLRLENGVVHVLHLVGGVADGDSTGHVGAVAHVGRAEVHGDEVALLNDALTGDAVGQAGIGAGYHNGVKGQTGAAVLVHAVDQLRLKLQLGHAGLDAGDDLGKGSVGDGLRLAHQLQLPVFLGAAEGVDGLVEGYQLGVQLLVVVEILLCGEIMLLIAKSGHAEIGNGRVQALDVAVLPVHLQNLKALQVLFGGLDVAAVGEVAAALLCDDGDALGDVEFRAVMAAVAGGQQQAVHIPVQQGQILVKIFHGQILLFFAGKINGSSST